MTAVDPNGSDLERTPTEAEVELLWAAARTHSDPKVVADAARESDLPYVLRASARQRVAPLVMRSLEDAGVDVSSAVDLVLQAKLWEAHARLALPEAAAATLGPLTLEGLKPLVLKGLALIERYPAPGLRPMDDIDLLLPSPLIRPATTALARAGWRRMEHRGLDPGYDLVFRNESVPGVPLELHYELARWQERTNGIDAQRLWTARVPIDVLGHPAWGLPRAIELLSLIAHAAKRFHLFNRLMWAVDFTVVADDPALDWDEVSRLTSETHCRLAVAVGLRLARRLGAEIPDDLVKLPPLLERSGALDILLDPTRPFLAKAAGQRRLAYVLVDDTRGKVRLAAGDLLRPPRGEPRVRVAEHIIKSASRGVRRLARASVGGSRDS